MGQTNKILNWIVKIAGMIICAPVTWLVAAGLFADVQPAPARGLVQLAAGAAGRGCIPLQQAAPRIR